MKGVVYTKYGSPDVLQLKEVEKLAPKDNEVLIKVHAAPINSWDWDMLTGRPFEYRLLSGLLKPTKIKILGCDIAGRIETVGRNIKLFHPGDDVFGYFLNGSFLYQNGLSKLNSVPKFLCFYISFNILAGSDPMLVKRA